MNPADLFSRETDTLNLASGDTLFKSGEPGDAMFILLEGAMDVMVGGKVVERSTRGAIVGEMAIIDQSPRGATVVARESSRLAKIDQRRFLYLIQQNPFFATHVMKVLADRLRQMNQLVGQKPGQQATGGPLDFSRDL
jgi:CRP-like cAMP-binding protein